MKGKLPMWQPDRLEALSELAGELSYGEVYQEAPKQKVPSWIRWPLRVILLPFVLLDLLTQRIASLILRPPFKQEGSCKKRGNCCYFVVMEEPDNLLGRLYFFWNTEINGFYDRIGQAVDYEGRRSRLLGCRYLKKDGKCAHYHLRPMQCRKWPLIRYFSYPRILKGCGYKGRIRSSYGSPKSLD